MDIRNLSYVIRAVYDLLPTPTNLHQWVGAHWGCCLLQTSLLSAHPRQSHPRAVHVHEQGIWAKAFELCRVSCYTRAWTWKFTQWRLDAEASLERLAAIQLHQRQLSQWLWLKTNNPCWTPQVARSPGVMRSASVWSFNSWLPLVRANSVNGRNRARRAVPMMHRENVTFQQASPNLLTNILPTSPPISVCAHTQMSTSHPVF